MKDDIFYVYIYLDPRKEGIFKYGKYKFDYEPFYIGKGSLNRLYDHIRMISYDKSNLIKSSKIKHIISECDCQPIVIKYQDCLSEKDAFDLEKIMIRTIGRISIKTGPLSNLTDGGDGLGFGINHPWFGHHHTTKTKNKLSEMKMGNKNPTKRKDVQEKMRLSHLGKKRFPHTQTTKNKMCKIKLGDKNPMNKYTYSIINNSEIKIDCLNIYKGIKIRRVYNEL